MSSQKFPVSILSENANMAGDGSGHLKLFLLFEITVIY